MDNSLLKEMRGRTLILSINVPERHNSVSPALRGLL